MDHGEEPSGAKSHNSSIAAQLAEARLAMSNEERMTLPPLSLYDSQMAKMAASSRGGRGAAAAEPFSFGTSVSGGGKFHHAKQHNTNKRRGNHFFRNPGNHQQLRRMTLVQPSGTQNSNSGVTPEASLSARREAWKKSEKERRRFASKQIAQIRSAISTVMDLKPLPSSDIDYVELPSAVLGDTVGLLHDLFGEEESVSVTDAMEMGEFREAIVSSSVVWRSGKQMADEVVDRCWIFRERVEQVVAALVAASKRLQKKHERSAAVSSTGYGASKSLQHGASSPPEPFGNNAATTPAATSRLIRSLKGGEALVDHSNLFKEADRRMKQQEQKEEEEKAAQQQQRRSSSCQQQDQELQQQQLSLSVSLAVSASSPCSASLAVNPSLSPSRTLPKLYLREEMDMLQRQLSLLQKEKQQQDGGLPTSPRSRVHFDVGGVNEQHDQKKKKSKPEKKDSGSTTFSSLPPIPKIASGFGCAQFGGSSRQAGGGGGARGKEAHTARRPPAAQHQHQQQPSQRGGYDTARRGGGGGGPNYM